MLAANKIRLLAMLNLGQPLPGSAVGIAALAKEFGARAAHPKLSLISLLALSNDVS